MGSEGLVWVRRKTYRRKKSSISVDGAIRSRRGNTYLRVLASTRYKKALLTGKVSAGSRGREVGAYAKGSNFSGGASYNFDTGKIEPILRHKKKKIL